MSSVIDEHAQATIEAAFVLPILMLLFLMLLQPGIVLYDRMVMNGAAAEGCRLMSTLSSDEKRIAEDFIRRRLSAIPQVDFFHVHQGGCSYDIRLSGSESSEQVTVRVSNRLKPLPLLDMTMSLAGMTDSNGTLGVDAEASSRTQPSWAPESADGRNPKGWAES